MEAKISEGIRAGADYGNGNFIRSTVRKLCYAVFGVTAFANLADPFNITNIVYGIVVGLIFGLICKVFLSGIMGLLNRDLKEKHGKKVISHAVEKGMTFMFPFAVMGFLASFVLGWTLTSGFVSAALMTAGASAAMEIGKLKEKPSIKNTILASVLSWAFVTVWLFSINFLSKVPPYLEGGIKLLISLKDNFLK